MAVCCFRRCVESPLLLCLCCLMCVPPPPPRCCLLACKAFDPCTVEGLCGANSLCTRTGDATYNCTCLPGFNSSTGANCTLYDGSLTPTTATGTSVAWLDLSSSLAPTTATENGTSSDSSAGWVESASFSAVIAAAAAATVLLLGIFVRVRVLRKRRATTTTHAIIEASSEHQPNN